MNGSSLTKVLRVLHLEDSPHDREMIQAVLENENVSCDVRFVETRRDFLAALETEQFDLILSDHALPAFDGLSALAIVREKSPETPFIFVTGSMGEETAIETIKNGATDYVLKDRLARLVPAIRRAAREAHEREQRQQAEEALRVSEDYGRRIIDSSLDMIIATDLERRVTRFNRAAEQTLGYRADEVLGQHIDLLYASPEQNLQVHLATLNTGQCVQEVLNRRKNGEVFPCLLSASALRNQHGELIGYMGTSRDITERKKAEERVREQAALLDEARDAIFVCDLDDCIRYWNKSAERILGWPIQEALGRKGDALLCPQDSKRLTEANQSLFERGEWHGELTLLRKDQQPILVESRWTLVRHDDGSPRAKLIINTDITERKKLEAAFLRAQRMESIGALAGGIAHDLNNVLAPVLMGVQLLRAKLPQADDVRLLDTLESSAQRGAGMVKQILSFVRGAQGERKVLQVKHLVLDMVKVAKQTFPRTIQVRSKSSPDLWPILGDPTQLYQVMMNLFLNARDAMPTGGNLSIEIENVVLDENYAGMQPEAKPGPYVVLSVIDTGTGIPAQIIDKIFDPFFSTKELGKGTGLGLSTVVGIVKSHGGFVTVYSELNQGSQFKVYLPAVQSPETRQVEERKIDLPLGQGELLLVVDDERTIREINSRMLESFGYRVMTASDGTEALALFAQNPKEIQVVITDMSMPFMDGPATIRALRKIEPKLRIIAVSGLIEQRNTSELVASGAIEFLQKPYSTEQLLTLLQQVLRKA